MSSDCCKFDRSCSVNKVILSNGHVYVNIFLGMIEDNFPAIRFVLFYSIKSEKSGTELSFFEDQTRASKKLSS